LIKKRALKRPGEENQQKKGDFTHARKPFDLSLDDEINWGGREGLVATEKGRTKEEKKNSPVR